MAIPPEEPLTEYRDRPNRRRDGFWKRTGAIATSFLTVTGMMLGSAVPAAADNGDHRSHAEGHLIDADLLGLNLADAGVAEQHFLDYDGEAARGTINAALLEELVSLDLGGISLPILGDGLEVGAVSSYAHTPSPTEATASAGVITQDGSIDISGSGEDPYGYATVDLTDALGQVGLNLDGVVDELGLQLGAVASTATANNGEIDSEYAVAGARLALDAPVLDDVTTLVSDATGGLDDTVNGLLGPEGPVQELLNTLSFDELDVNLGGLLPVLSVDLGSPELQVQAGLEELVDGLIGESLVSDSGITTIDLSQGQIYIDLEVLHGEGLNNLPANTQLLTSDEITQITGEVSALLGELLDSVTSALEEALGETSVTVTLDPDLSAIGGVVSGNAEITIDTTIAELLGDQVSEDAINISGGLSVLGLPIPLLDLVGALLEPILNDVVPAITGPLVSELGNLGTLVADSLDGVLDPVLTSLDPVLNALPDVASVVVNAQEEPGNLGDTSFSVSALRVDVLPGANVVSLPLATSSVYAENAADYDPVVTVDPDTADAGESVTVGGSDFVPNSTVTVDITDANDEVVDTLEGVEVNENGEFSSDWIVPEDTTPGELTVTATDDQDPSISGTATLTINEQAESVQITSPTDGETITGDSVSVTGTAEPAVEVDVTLDGQTNTVTSGPDGSWDTVFEGVEPGDYTVTAADEVTQDEVDFTVAAEEPVDDNTADNTDVNTSDNTSENTGDNTEVNTSENTGDNTDVNTEVNTEVNTSENTSDNTDVNTAENDADNTEVNTEVNTEANTSDNAEDNAAENTDVNTADNQADNAGDNTDDNTSENTGDNTAENEADNTEVNTSENTGDNTDVNTEVNTATNVEVNTADNTEVNTEANTSDNAAENTDVNTADNQADNAGDNTDDNTSENTGDNTAENEADNTEANTSDNAADNQADNTSDNNADNTIRPEIWVTPSEVDEGGDATVYGGNFSEDSTVTIGIREMPGGEVEPIVEDAGVDENGEFYEDVSLEGYGPGNYQIVVTDNQTGREVQESLRINEAAWLGEIEVTPSVIELGESTTIYGEGYTPSEMATVVLEPLSDDGEPITLDENVVIEDDGSIEYVIDTSERNEQLQAGNYRVVVMDNVTENTSSQVITLDGPEREVTIRLTPKSIEEGADSIRIIGEGYTPSTDADVFLERLGQPTGQISDSDQAEPLGKVATAAVNADGRINFHLDTSELETGDYRVTVQDGDIQSLSDFEAFTVSPVEDSEDNADAGAGDNAGDNADAGAGDNAGDNADAGAGDNAGDNTGNNSLDHNSGDNGSVASGGNDGKSGGNGSHTGGSLLASTGATTAAFAVGAVLLLILGAILVVRARRNAIAK